MKIVYKLAIVAILLTATSAAKAQEYCIAEKLNTDMTGIWTGDDSYSLAFRVDKTGRTCVKLVEPNSTTFRKVRDVVVVKGEIRHLTYYTPSTDGYVANMNIVIKGNEMKFHWFGSYENKQGNDTYVRKPPTKPQKPSK
jgi:hypothetical protein